MIQIRPYHPDDLLEILKLIERSDSTNRDKASWLGNDMTAVLAFDDNQLIAAIPFERREIVVADNSIMKVLWASGVHVDEKYRNQKIGSRMDEKVGEYFKEECDAVLVCREDQESPAYRWYQKNKYRHLCNILSLKCDVPPSFYEDYQIFDTKESVENIEVDLLQCFKKYQKTRYGFVQRGDHFWSKKFDSHYYKESYEYSVLTIKKDSSIEAFALLGRTSLRDGIDRFDILEFTVSNDSHDKECLLNAIFHYAHKVGLAEVRTQVVDEDPYQAWLSVLGFQERWRTNILGKSIKNDFKIPSLSWRFFQSDYI